MTDPAADPNALPEDPAPPASEAAEPELGDGAVAHDARAKPVSGPRGASLRSVGIGLGVLGACLAAAPHVSAWAARALAGLVAPELYGGLLITAGLGLFIGGLLRRTLTGIRSSLSELSSETARLDELSDSVEQVQHSNQDLKLGLSELQQRLERLTEIASDPEHTVSMFRLAASVDQLGARLDIFIKDQFKSMQQRLAELEKLFGEQHTAQRQAWVEGFAKADAGAARAAEGISASLLKTATALNEGQSELGARIAQHIQEQTTYVAECLGQLDGSLLRSASERDALARELGARLERQLAERTAELQQGFVPLAAAAQRAEQAEGRLPSMLDQLQAHVAAQHQALQLALEQGLVRVQTVSTETGLATAANLEAAARIQTSLKDSKEVLIRAFASTREDWSRSSETWNAGLGRLGETIERGLREQLASVDGQLSAMAGQLGRIDSALDGGGKAETEDDSQAVALAQRLVLEISGNSSRLERMAAELAGLASLAERASVLRSEEPVGDTPVPSGAVVVPEVEPAPALPVNRDSRSDVIP